MKWYFQGNEWHELVKRKLGNILFAGTVMIKETAISLINDLAQQTYWFVGSDDNVEELRMEIDLLSALTSKKVGLTGVINITFQS